MNLQLTSSPPCWRTINKRILMSFIMFLSSNMAAKVFVIWIFREWLQTTYTVNVKAKFFVWDFMWSYTFSSHWVENLQAELIKTQVCFYGSFSSFSNNIMYQSVWSPRLGGEGAEYTLRDLTFKLKWYLTSGGKTPMSNAPFLLLWPIICIHSLLQPFLFCLVMSYALWGISLKASAL